MVHRAATTEFTAQLVRSSTGPPLHAGCTRARTRWVARPFHLGPPAHNFPMKALEKKCILMSDKEYVEKKWRQHRERLKATKKLIDTSHPKQWRNGSPTKLVKRKDREQKDHIVRENYVLARRLFDIMEGNSALSEHINDTAKADGHPGTMNFKRRLHEARRIHERNMILASRLDNIKPYYKVSDLSVVQCQGRASPRSRKNNKTRFMKELEQSLQAANRLPLTEEEMSESDVGIGYCQDFKFADFYKEKIRSSAQARGSSGEQTAAAARPRNLLLEYSKVQNDRVLDIAVVKEPFKDRYIIFGMDVDNGQRYELRITSEDVSNILDGDILVTSVDNVEVWMALLNKVDLLPVELFQKDDEPEIEVGTPPDEFAGVVPHAPDASARPTMASGHRQHRAVAASANIMSDHSQVLDVFAGGSSLLDGTSEPSVPNLFPAPPTSAPEAFIEPAPAAPANPPKKRGVQIVLEEPKEGEEPKRSNWKPPLLTPKPPAQRKQAGGAARDGKNNVVDTNTTINSGKKPVLQKPSAPAVTKPQAGSRPPRLIKPSLATAQDASAVDVQSVKAPPFVAVASTEPSPVPEPPEPTETAAGDVELVGATVPSSAALRGGSTSMVSLHSQLTDQVTLPTQDDLILVRDDSIGTFYAEPEPEPELQRGPELQPEPAQPIGEDALHAASRHEAVQEQASRAVELAISSALLTLASPARAVAARDEERDDEGAPAVNSSPVRDSLPDIAPAEALPTAASVEDDGYLEASFEDVSFAQTSQVSPRQHNEDDLQLTAVDDVAEEVAAEQSEDIEKYLFDALDDEEVVEEEI